MTAYGLPSPFERGEAGNILPLAMQYLAPPWLSVLGIGSIAAAVMSSMDSALLSSASMFTQNVYKRSLRKQVCAREWLVMKNGDDVYNHSFPAGLGPGAAVGDPWQPGGGGLGRNGSGIW